MGTRQRIAIAVVLGLGLIAAAAPFLLTYEEPQPVSAADAGAVDRKQAIMASKARQEGKRVPKDPAMLRSPAARPGKSDANPSK